MHAVEMSAVKSETKAWRRRVQFAHGLRVVEGHKLLYESMRMHGSLAQRDLARVRGRGFRPSNTDDVSVAIARGGELLLCQGGHRVEVARSLGIELIPVWVGVRHTEW